MTRRRGKLRPCVWCGLVWRDGVRVSCTFDLDGGRYHPACLVAKLEGKPQPCPPEEERP